MSPADTQITNLEVSEILGLSPRTAAKIMVSGLLGERQRVETDGHSEFFVSREKTISLSELERVSVDIPALQINFNPFYSRRDGRQIDDSRGQDLAYLESRVNSCDSNIHRQLIRNHPAVVIFTIAGFVIDVCDVKLYWKEKRSKEGVLLREFSVSLGRCDSPYLGCRLADRSPGPVFWDVNR